MEVTVVYTVVTTVEVTVVYTVVTTVGTKDRYSGDHSGD